MSRHKLTHLRGMIPRHITERPANRFGHKKFFSSEMRHTEGNDQINVIVTLPTALMLN
jgi:hypothetical protein